MKYFLTILSGIFLVSLSFSAHAQTVLVDESFDSCSMPSGWSTNIVAGDDGWVFGQVNNGNAWAGTSMNGTCMAFFDDDVLGDNAPHSIAQLISPVFDGLAYEQLDISFQLHFRGYSNSNLKVKIKSGNDVHTVDTYVDEEISGNQFVDYDTMSYDISAFRGPNMQLIFEYDDDDNWAWWTAVDEVIVTGAGSFNDLCLNAEPLIVGDPCVSASSIYAWYDGPIPTCSDDPKASMWYTFEAPASGNVIIKSNASFNDVLTLYDGSCGVFTEISCIDNDMFGFKGESLQSSGLTPGTTYYVCISGKLAEFGLDRGEHCVKVIEGNVNPNTPPNDICINAIEMTDGPCIIGTNKYATFDGPEPSRNLRSRASIWYYFTAGADGTVSITTEADFADVITLYSGACGSLSEVLCNEEGQILETDGLIPGDTYYAQVAGYFSTLEGAVCMKVGSPLDAPSNDVCINAEVLTIGASCLTGYNNSADADGILSSCDPNPTGTIWYAFDAPASGEVIVNTGADFAHNITVMSGLCNDLEEMTCLNNLSLCDGPRLIQALNPFETYYLQVSSSSNYVANQGDVCVSISDGASSPADNSLALDVTVTCNGDGTGIISYSASNGAGGYQYYGTNDGVSLSEGTWYTVTVEDANGCSVTETASVSCSGAVESCITSDLSIDLILDCNPAGGDDGSAVIFYSASGGDGNYTWTTDLNNGDILTEGESYTVMLQDGEGCSKTETGIVQNIGSSLTASIDNLPTSLGSDQPVSLSGTPAGGTWSGTGIVSNAFNPVIAGVGNHTISYTVSDGDGCPSTATQNIFVFSITYDFAEYGSSPISPKIFNDLIEVYPNPTQGAFNISLPALDTDSDFTIHIFDAQGKVLHFEKLSPYRESYNSLSLSDQVDGIYVVRIQVGDLISVKRVVKQ